MNWVWIGATVVILLIVVPIIVGLFLSPPFRVSAVRDIDHSPEATWAALNNYQAVPMAGPQCRGITTVESQNGLPSWKESMGPSTVLIETIAARQPSQLVRRFSDSVVPMTMELAYTIEPVGQENGCRLRVEGDGRIDSGTWHVPLFRFIVKILGMAAKGQRNYLAAVAAHLDAKSA
jgi:hypothetical protein